MCTNHTTEWNKVRNTDRRIKTMNALKAVPLFTLVWTFTAVCQDDKDISVSCDDITGSVEKEVTSNCRVSLKNDCCIKKYIFKCNDLKICENVLPDDPCEHSKGFACSYTLNKTGKYSSFVQASCGWKKTEFTLDTSGNLRRMNPENPTAVDLGSEDTLITVVVSGSIVMLLIVIVIMSVIYKTKPSSTKLSDSRKEYF